MPRHGKLGYYVHAKLSVLKLSTNSSERIGSDLLNAIRSCDVLPFVGYCRLATIVSALIWSKWQGLLKGSFCHGMLFEQIRGSYIYIAVAFLMVLASGLLLIF